MTGQTGTKLYWLVTEAYVCKQLVQGRLPDNGMAESQTRDLLSCKPTSYPLHCQVTEKNVQFCNENTEEQFKRKELLIKIYTFKK